MNEKLQNIAAPCLVAYEADWERRLRVDHRALGQIAASTCDNTAVHVLYPLQVERNIQKFQRVFKQEGVEGDIYYGKKANKANEIVKVCARNMIGVDISSNEEMDAAMRYGIAGNKLVVTGPAKPNELLAYALQKSSLIAIDEINEFERLARLSEKKGRRARVLLRVMEPGSQSRFGMIDEELNDLLARQTQDAIGIEGFSFHLGGYNSQARANLAAELIEKCKYARSLGHAATTISIGGGFGVDYLPKEPWDEFNAGDSRLWFHGGKKFDSYYPYHFENAGADMLTQILRHNQLASRLSKESIRLAIEPGRALLDQAGSSVFKIQGLKTRYEHGQPYQIATVNGSSLSLSEQWFNSEYLPDPRLWPILPDTGQPTPTVVAGGTCLESDMLSWRRILLPRPPELGDLLVYPNTAGYQMDSNESTFHERAIPSKFVLYDTLDDKLCWWPDQRRKTNSPYPEK